MNINGHQIAAQFETYGAPPEAIGFFADNGFSDTSKIDIDAMPAHGVRAVKELMAYTTGLDVVLAIACIALGEQPAAEHGASVQFIPNGVETIDPEDEPTDETPVSRNGVELFDGLRVRVVDVAADGETQVEGAGLTGEIDRIESRGGVNIVFLQVDAEPGHTEGSLIQVRADNVDAIEEI